MNIEIRLSRGEARREYRFGTGHRAAARGAESGIPGTGQTRVKGLENVPDVIPNGRFEKHGVSVATMAVLTRATAVQQ